MKRTLTLASVLLIGLSPMAMASNGNGNGNAQKHYKQQAKQKHDTRDDRNRSDHRDNRGNNHDRRDFGHAQREIHHDRRDARQAARSHVDRPGRAPSSYELRRLPPLPHGQSYRIVDNRLVRIDNDTARVMATLGLLSLFLNN